MHLTVSDRGDGVSHVALVGRLDLNGLNAVNLTFHGHTAARQQPAIVDLTQLEFIASLGLGMFIACAQALKHKGCKMVIVGAHGIVDATLRTTGLDRAIPMVQSLDEALRLIGVAEGSA